MVGKSYVIILRHAQDDDVTSRMAQDDKIDVSN